jgi:hypothetical protein
MSIDVPGIICIATALHLNRLEKEVLPKQSSDLLQGTVHTVYLPNQLELCHMYAIQL